MNSELSEQLTRIEKMLTALLKSEDHIWWIGGFVFGRTSNDDPFVILYPAAEHLKEKVVRVYEHDFKKLPPLIDTTNVPADTEANPNKTQAEKKGIYHPCPLFQVVTYSGKETQMGPERRFGDVLRISQQPAPTATAAPTGKTRQSRQSRQQRQPKLTPATPPPPPPADDDPPLPDYRQMAVDAQTANGFDYAAFMVLKNGLYTEQDHITKTRESLFPDWKPEPQANTALLEALQVYRDKRLAAMKRGDTVQNAHSFASIEAKNRFNRLMKSGS